ncbi:MAG: hypothetical protein ACE5KV_03205 [Thermoplasmata archaeon]
MSLDIEDMRIVALVGSRNMTLEEICEELSLAPYDCFSRIRRLESLGLVERVQQCVTTEGKTVRAQNLYKAKPLEDVLPQLKREVHL